MKRFFLGIVILIFSLTLCTVGQIDFLKSTESIKNDVIALMLSAENESREDVKRNLEKLEDTLEKAEKKLNVLIFHSDIEDIETNIMSLNELFDFLDFKAFRTYCVEIINEIENLEDSLSFSLGNIF